MIHGRILGCGLGWLATVSLLCVEPESLVVPVSCSLSRGLLRKLGTDGVLFLVLFRSGGGLAAHPHALWGAW